VELKGKKVLVTGGASFIGSTLVDALLAKDVRGLLVIDDLSAGRYANIKEHNEAGRIGFIKADIREQNITRNALRTHRPDIVFHLAADHGGRGYVDLHNAECANNLFLSGLVLHECVKAGVKKIVFASSGCVYPNNLQTDVSQELFLTEDLVGPPYLDKPQFSDNLYGYEKLMTEMTLYHYVKGGKLPSAASCRYFTVYGPRGKLDHAILAMIGRAFIKQDPFKIWGDGNQLRNWTHVSDIVSGTIAAAEYEGDYIAVNLGTMEKTSVLQAAVMAIEYARERHGQEYHPELEFLTEMPTGPKNRIADNKLAKKELGWEPKIKLADGLRETAKWFFETQDVEKVKAHFADEMKLTER